MATPTHTQYKAPNGTPSSISNKAGAVPAGNSIFAGKTLTAGEQFRVDMHQRMSLEEAAKERYFGQMASVVDMPKHFGKKIRKYHYLPLLDDANMNDQGIDAAGATIANGNLYGSSKDVGTIKTKLPKLTENGGRVNRVGFKRKDLEGTFEKFGFFSEYSKESLDFDTDPELLGHLNREQIMGANEMTEDALQIDLLEGAGVLVLPGAASTVADLDGSAVPSYNDFMNLSIQLDKNRTPKETKIITGTRNTDTLTVSGGRFMFVGTELIPMLRNMLDNFGNQAFIEAKHYAAGTTLARGEIGAIDGFRICVVPEMMNWEGVGKAADAGAVGVISSGGKAVVFPMLVIGDGAFTTIGFQTSGKGVKFKIKHVAPESDAAYSSDNPYGELGFSSIKWYYGFMMLRPERLALIKCTSAVSKNP